MSDLIGPVYPWVNALHVLSLGLLLGAITVLDLRLLGAFRSVAVSQLAQPSMRVAGSGLCGAILTGALLFSVQPAHYLSNVAFLAKLAIVAAGLVNLVLLRLSPGWSNVLQGHPPTFGIRLMAGISLGLWFAAVMAGRWIAYI